MVLVFLISNFFLINISREDNWVQFRCSSSALGENLSNYFICESEYLFIIFVVFSNFLWPFFNSHRKKTFLMSNLATKYYFEVTKFRNYLNVVTTFSVSQPEVEEVHNSKKGFVTTQKWCRSFFSVCHNNLSFPVCFWQVCDAWRSWVCSIPNTLESKSLWSQIWSYIFIRFFPLILEQILKAVITDNILANAISKRNWSLCKIFSLGSLTGFLREKISKNFGRSFWL